MRSFEDIGWLVCGIIVTALFIGYLFTDRPKPVDPEPSCWSDIECEAQAVGHR